MSPQQKSELHKKNQEYLANKRAKRKALAAAKKGRKQPAEVKATEPTETAPERAPEAPPRHQKPLRHESAYRSER